MSSEKKCRRRVDPRGGPRGRFNGNSRIRHVFLNIMLFGLKILRVGVGNWGTRFPGTIELFSIMSLSITALTFVGRSVLLLRVTRSPVLVVKSVAFQKATSSFTMGHR